MKAQGDDDHPGIRAALVIVALARVGTRICLGHQTRALTATELKLRYAQGHAPPSRSYPAHYQDPDLATQTAHQPTTSQGFLLVFPDIQTTDDTEATPVTLCCASRWT